MKPARKNTAHARRDALISAAREAAVRAYAPYSGYRVGAAVRARDGRIFSGCNVENASYGLTICAERSAVCQAVAAGAAEVIEAAIASPGAALPSPCGACRQVLSEFMPPEAVVWVAGRSGKPRRYRMRELLPAPFEL